MSRPSSKVVRLADHAVSLRDQIGYVHFALEACNELTAEAFKQIVHDQRTLARHLVRLARRLERLEGSTKTARPRNRQ